MYYKITITKQKKARIEYITQVFWVEIDVPSTDPQLKDKILFGLNYLRYETIYDEVLVGHGGMKMEIIPISDPLEPCINLNETLAPFEESFKKDKFTLERLDDINKAFNDAISTLFKTIDKDRAKPTLKLIHELAMLRADVVKLFDSDPERKEARAKRGDLNLRKYVEEGVNDGTLTKDENGDYRSIYGDCYGPDENGRFICKGKGL